MMSMRSSYLEFLNNKINYISGYIIFERAKVVFSHCHTFLMYFCNNLITTLGNSAHFTDWNVSVCFFLKGFLSVPFLPATGFSLYQLFSFHNVVVLFRFTLCLSVRPGCLFRSTVSSVQQVAVQRIEMPPLQTAELRLLSHLHFGIHRETIPFQI